MRLPPVYGTVYRRQGRGPIFHKYIRFTAVVLIAIIAMNYGIRGYFWLMPRVVDWIAAL